MSGSAVGFIGFGEAGFHLARGLNGAGVGGLFAYDLHRGTPGLGETIRRRAGESGTVLVDSPGGLASRTDTLLSTVTADAALDAARQIAPHLEARHLYADMNSVSPEAKERVGAIVAEQRAVFVEVAIMGPVARSGHRVPLLLAGPGTAVFQERFGPYGMSMEFVSDKIGGAAAVKLCRSIVVKGLEALLLECAMAAGEYGAERRVFDSLGESFPGIDWDALASYMISRVVAHGGRRAREMEEASGMLTSIGIDPIMTLAAARRQDWCSKLGVREALGSESPEDYRAVAKAIRKLTKGS